MGMRIILRDVERGTAVITLGVLEQPHLRSSSLKYEDGGVCETQG